MYDFRMFSDLRPICPLQPREIVRGFSRLARTAPSLPPGDRRKIADIAKRGFASFAPGCVAVRSGDLTGHTDTDPQKDHRFERDMSVQCALKIERYLREAAVDSSKDFNAAPSSPVPADIVWTHNGVSVRYYRQPETRKPARACSWELPGSPETVGYGLTQMKTV